MSSGRARGYVNVQWARRTHVVVERHNGQLHTQLHKVPDNVVLYAAQSINQSIHSVNQSINQSGAHLNAAVEGDDARAVPGAEHPHAPRGHLCDRPVTTNAHTHTHTET